MDEDEVMAGWVPNLGDSELLEDWPSFPFDNSMTFSESQPYNPSSYAASETHSNTFDVDQDQNALENVLSSPMQSSRVADDSTAPIDRYFNQKSDPWYSRIQVDIAPLTVDSMSLGHYRDHDAASAASSVTGPYGDSGYKTFSAASADEVLCEPSTLDPDLSSLQHGMKMLEPSRRPSRASSHLSAPTLVSMSSKRPSKRTYEESTAGDNYVCKWEGCNETFRLQSDFRKHHLRHERPFKCNSCPQGFPTTNDLDRHKKTVHRNIPIGTKAFRCIISGCRSSQKIWYRQDNFQAHVKGHVGEIQKSEIDDIIDSSKFQVGFTSHPPVSPSLSPESFLNNKERCSDQSCSSDQAESSYLSANSLSRPASRFPDSLCPPKATASTPFQNSENATYDAGNFSGVNSGDLNTSSTASPNSTDENLAKSYEQDLSRDMTVRTPRNLAKSRPATQRSVNDTITTVTRARGRQPRRDRSAKSTTNSKTPVIVHQSMQSEPVVEHEASDLQNCLQSILEKNLNNEETAVALRTLLASQSSDELGKSLQVHDRLRRVSSVSAPSMRHRPSEEFDKIGSGRPHSSDSRCPRIISPSSDRLGNTCIDNKALPLPCSKSYGKSYCYIPGCNKSFPRRSALDKHIKRHQKPYACTFDTCLCSKVFGSKNDWKRHENSRHYQPELYRCEICYKTFETEQSMFMHAKDVHSVAGEAAVAFCSDRKIGVNHTGTFWCGFCHRIIPLTANQKGVEEWDERYNHIAAHFVPDRERPSLLRKIEDWLPPDGILTKGQKEHNTDDMEQKRIVCSPSFDFPPPVYTE